MYSVKRRRDSPIVDAESVELDPAEPAADAQDGPTPREVVEHGEALGDPHRVVPGQDRHHRPELDALGLSRHPGQEHEHLRRQLVVREVMLGRPHRVEADVLGPGRELEVAPVDLEVGASDRRGSGIAVRIRRASSSSSTFCRWALTYFMTLRRAQTVLGRRERSALGHGARPEEARDLARRETPVGQGLFRVLARPRRTRRECLEPCG